MTHDLRFLAVLASLSLAACDGDPPMPDAGPPTPDAGAECTHDPGEPEAIPEPELYTPRWAFEPWISKDISDGPDSYAFVDGFLDRDIPVGVLVLDSPWDEQYTTFVPNPDRYPDFEDFVDDMTGRGVRVVMWVTQMVNTRSFDAEMGGDTYRGRSPNYDEGCACGYFVNGCETYPWWKGEGSGVDFFDPAARQWWHEQQDALLAMGISGWKLDFGESYIVFEEGETLDTAAGPETPFQDYSEAYYEDYLAYGQHVRGREEFVTMVRAYDASYDRYGRFYARPEHAPVAWMGDNHRDWSGLIDALDHTFRSAEAGYVVLGSDMGGYLDRDQDVLTMEIPFDLEVFQRWVAQGAMTPFMQLHGRANLAPWTVADDPEMETVDIYRYWATLHHEMVGYWYSITEEAYAAGEVILHPQGAEADWPGDYRYVIGEAFLVAPVIAPGDQRDVELPSGARWYDWWDPAGDPLDGGQTLEGYAFPQRVRIPLFVREGAIVPLDVDSDVTGLGSAASAGHLTVLAWPGATESEFVLHEEDDATTSITAARATDGAVTITLSRARRPVLLQVYEATAPDAVSVGGTPLDEVADMSALEAATRGWLHDAATRRLHVKLEASDAAVTVATTPAST